MGSFRQIIAAVGVTAGLLAVAAPAFAEGTLTVSVSGAGAVTASGISCSRAINGPLSGDCSQDYLDVRTCEQGPLKPICFNEPQEITLTAGSPGNGFSFSGWGGACARIVTATCTLLMDSDQSASATFADTTDPLVSYTGPTGAVRSTVTLSATASDNAAVSRVDFSIGSKSVSDATAPFSAAIDTSGLADGNQTATATAVDSSGRAKSASVTLVVDNTPPSLNLGGTADGAAFGPGSTQSWTIQAGDKIGLAAVSCRVVAQGSGGSFGACKSGSTGHAVTGEPAGTYVFTARATDLAGNVTDVSRTFTIDTTPPVTTITSGVADGATTSDPALTWIFASSEPGTTFACRVYPAALTPGAFAPCSDSGSHTAAGFAPGVYTFEVRGTDAVGNVEDTPVKRTFTIVPPTAAAPSSGAVGGGGPSGAAAVQLLAAAKSVSAAPLLFTLGFSFANSTTRQTKLTALTAKAVPAGATLEFTCKTCTTKSFKQTLKKAGNVSLAKLIKKPLKVNATLTVAISKPGATTSIKTLKIRARKAPLVSTQCQPAGARKPSSC